MTMTTPAAIRAEAPPGSSARDEDTRLMAGVSRGDRAALGALYDRHAPAVYGLALRVLRRQQDAEAIVSDVFYEVWRKPNRFDPRRGGFRTYVLTLARCRAIDHVRASLTYADKTAAARDLAEGDRAEKQQATAPDGEAIERERRALVTEALGRLDSDHREPLLLAYFGGLKQRDIAEVLDTPIGTVKTRIRRGLMALRETLAKVRDV